MCMTLPLFTATNSLFSSDSSYWLSAKKCHTDKRAVSLQMSSVTYSGRAKISNHGSEPAESGRRAWNELERACTNLLCSICRRDCVSFINGLHDAINIKLGKPMRTPNDFVYLRNFINNMNEISSATSKRNYGSSFQKYHTLNQIRIK